MALGHAMEDRLPQTTMDARRVPFLSPGQDPPGLFPLARSRGLSIMVAQQGCLGMNVEASRLIAAKSFQAWRPQDLLKNGRR